MALKIIHLTEIIVNFLKSKKYYFFKFEGVLSNLRYQTSAGIYLKIEHDYNLFDLENIMQLSNKKRINYKVIIFSIR